VSIIQHLVERIEKAFLSLIEQINLVHNSDKNLPALCVEVSIDGRQTNWIVHTLEENPSHGFLLQKYFLDEKKNFAAREDLSQDIWIHVENSSDDNIKQATDQTSSTDANFSFESVVGVSNIVLSAIRRTM
jgi:hypothetical protein